MTKTYINTSTPVGGDSPRQGDDKIRELKRAIVDLMQVDHYMGSPTGSVYDSDDAGKHRKITFAEDQEAKPTLASLDTGAAYTKSGELYYEDASGNEIQLTDGGKLNGAALKDDSVNAAMIELLNNTFLTQKDSAGTARNLIGLNASNQTILGGTKAHDVRLSDATASGDDDRHIADKGYVDGKFPDDDAFGSWASKAVNTTYTAESDGFVVVYGKSSVHGYGSILGYTPVATLRAANGSGYADVHYSGITMPVKKGHTWKVATENWGTGSLSIWWLPVGG